MKNLPRAGEQGSVGAARPGGTADGRDVPALYMICLKLQDEVTCVVGGGKVAARKVESLLEAGARVHVIAEQICESLRAMLGEGRYRSRLTWQQQAYQDDLPAGVRLVIACTDDREVNERISRHCRQQGIWCNVVDAPDLCDFFVPAVRKAGRLQVAVTTTGASPALARRLADQIEARIDPPLAQLTDLLAEIRPEVLNTIDDIQRRKALFDELCGEASLDLLRDRGEDEWRRWFQQLLARYRR